jgi:uncharacterized protein (TIGR00369 family)
VSAQSPKQLDELREWFNELPVVVFFSLNCTELRPGDARFLMDTPDSLRNPDGAINGGLIAAAADLAAGIAASSGGAEFLGSATSDLSIHFMAAARLTPLVIEASVLRKGRRSCVPHVRISDAEGKLCAVATGTWVLRQTAEETYRALGSKAYSAT